VLSKIGIPGENILYFDDNQLNIDPASALGIKSFKVSGMDEVENVLKGLNICK
jgi:FMN phosphatase YigB (HAD superfamily)